MKTIIHIVVVIAALFLFYNPYMIKAEEMTSERLLHLHQSSIAEITNLTAEYSVTDEDKTAAFIWSFASSCEILQWVPDKSNIDQRRQVSYFTGSNKAVFSTIATPAELESFAPLSIKESLDSGINFTQTLKDFDLNFFTPRSHFLFTSSEIARSGKSMPVQDLIAKSPWSSIPQLSFNERNERIWTIYIADSVLDHITQNEIFSNNKSFIQIDFNETKHFLIERMLTFIPAHVSPLVRKDNQKKLPLVFETWISDYYDVEANISFPKKVYSGRGTPWARKYSQEKKDRVFYNKVYSICSVNINSDSAIKCIRIPEYAKVYRNDLISDSKAKKNGFTPVSFWGKDNMPQITFLNEKEYNDYVDKEFSGSTQ